jgi:hypothetical protein
MTSNLSNVIALFPGAEFDIFKVLTDPWRKSFKNNGLEKCRNRCFEVFLSCFERLQGTCFKGRQTAAARFILCIHTQTVAGLDEVARHRCHNPLCINPEHLELGSQADNRQDDFDREAGGVSYELL